VGGGVVSGGRYFITLFCRLVSHISGNGNLALFGVIRLAKFISY